VVRTWEGGGRWLVDGATRLLRLAAAMGRNDSGLSVCGRWWLVDGATRLLRLAAAMARNDRRSGVLDERCAGDGRTTVGCGSADGASGEGGAL